MEKIYIPHLLNSPNRQRTIVIDDPIEGLNLLTPVRGQMTVRHGSNFLEVTVSADTILALTCDRCLKHYNQRFHLDTSEIIWLDKNQEQDRSYPLEREIAWEDLSESLAPEGDFEPTTWLYEQLSLAMPLRQLCGEDCQAPEIEQAAPPPIIDNRWARLQSIKNQLN
ncbi:MAG: hypothetical protein N5P05_002972 [Chroococcopsis gigantea SAG 12.99]|jgi:uncharacterized protein|nr:DUF177 domain-containing protein [Chlorogloea purpurea SAG 13.99]MDV3001366.1 hypothetical protein [Chroococcopsis gigantea SAG 12.99]